PGSDFRRWVWITIAPFVTPEYKEEIKSGSGSQFGDRISSLLGDIANVVTVAGALPSLPAAIQTALSLLSK
ncbi:hypothetical protein FSI18_022585, partial [Escherichia coli]|nr:hypothetical protein [Escherichia coli]